MQTDPRPTHPRNNCQAWLATQTQRTYSWFSCRDVSFDGASSALILPYGVNVRIDCNHHALQLAGTTKSANGSRKEHHFELGTQSTVVFLNCRLSNYLPGGAAEASKLADSNTAAVVPTLFGGDKQGGNATVLNSIMEHPCAVCGPFHCIGILPG